MRFWEYQRATDYYQQKAARLKPQQPAPQPAPAQDITPYQPSSPAPQPQAGNSALPAWAAQPFAQQQTAPTNQFGLTQYTQPTPLEQQNLYGPQLVAQEQAVQQQLGYDPYNTWLNREGRLTPGSALMGLMNVGTQSVGIPLLGAITAGLAPGQQVDTSGGLADIYKQWQAIEHARAPVFNIPAGPLNINEKWISENFLADPFFWTGIGATAMAGKAATAGAKAAELGGEATEAGLKMLQQAARWKKAADVVQTAENITSPLSWPGTAGRGLRALSQGGGILQDLGEESAEQFARSGARIPNMTREALLTMPAAQRAMALSGIDEQLAASAPYALGGNLPLWAVNKMAESPALRTAADVAGRGLGAVGFATTIQPRIAQAGVTGAMGLVQGLSGGIPKLLGREIPQELIDRLGPEAAEAAWRRAGLGQIVSSPFKAVGGSLVGELGDITGLDRLRARTAANQVGREALGAEAGAADLGALAPTPAEEERRLAAARAAGGFLWKNAKPQFKGMTVGVMPPDIDDGALTSDFANPLQKTRIKPYDWAWVDKKGNWATLDENGQRRELLTRGDEDTAGVAAGEEIGRLKDEYAAKQQAQPAVATEAPTKLSAPSSIRVGDHYTAPDGRPFTILSEDAARPGNFIVAIHDTRVSMSATEINQLRAEQEIAYDNSVSARRAAWKALEDAHANIARARSGEQLSNAVLANYLDKVNRAVETSTEMNRISGIANAVVELEGAKQQLAKAYAALDEDNQADVIRYGESALSIAHRAYSPPSFARLAVATEAPVPATPEVAAPVAEPAVRPEEAPAAGTLLGAQLDSPEAINATEGLRYAPELRSEGEWRNGTILLGPKFLELTAESKTGVLAHERAHGVEDTLSDTRIAEVIELAKQNVWGPYDAERAVINGINGEYKPLENFTEAVAMLGLDPLWLKSKYPQATEYVLRVLREDQHPLPAQAVEKLGLQIPADYVREGDQYVYRPAAPEVVPEVGATVPEVGARETAPAAPAIEEPAVRPDEGVADAEQRPATYGKDTFAFGPDPNDRYPLRWKVVELDDLVASDNPAYPQELQPRMRDRLASKEQIAEIQQKFVPEALLVDSHDVAHGTPIVGGDNVVEGGNGRVMALRAIVAGDPQKYEAYRAELQKYALEYGLDAAALSAMRAPVLVRENNSPVNRAFFAASTNVDSTQRMSRVEQARQDARQLNWNAVQNLVVSEDETIDAALRSPKNRPLAQAFMAIVPMTERNLIVDTNGTLSREGAERIRAALIAKMLPGEAGTRLTNAFLDSLDNDVKRIEAGYIRAMPAMLRAETLLGRGERDAEFSLSEDLSKAVDVLARLRASRTKLADYLGQGTMLFERELTPFQEKLLTYLDDIGKSSRLTREFLTSYAEQVEQLPPVGQGTMFGAISKATKEGLVDNAYNRTTGNATAKVPVQRPTFFGEPNPPKAAPAAITTGEPATRVPEATGRSPEGGPVADAAKEVAAPRVETPVAAPDEQITTTRQVRVERTGDTVSLAYGIRDLGSFKLGEWPTDEAAQKTFLSTLMGSPRDQRLWGDRAEIDALVKRGLTAQGVPVAALEGLPVATVAPEPEAPKPVEAEAPAPKPEAPTAKPPRSANTTYNTAAVLNGDVMTLTYKERSRNIRADKWPSEYKEQLRTMRELFQGMTVPPDALADLRKRANSVLKKAAAPPPAPPAAPQPAASVAPPAPPAAAVPPTGTAGQPPLPGAGRVPPSTTPPTAGILPPAAPTAPRPQPVAAPTTGERVFADKKELSDAIAELSPSVRKSIGETAVKTRDLYTEMGPAQADAVVQRVLKYGDIGKLFEADDMGRAWVKRNGATARERVALDDVLQNPSQFDLSGKQEEVTRAFGPIYRDAMRVLKEYGVKTADRTQPDPDNPDLPPLEQFIARRTIGFYNPDTGKFDMFQQFPDGKIHPVMPASFQRRRFYNTKEEAIADGGVYMKPEEALRGYITQMYRKVGDVMMGEYLIKNLVPIHEKAQGADVEFRIPGLMGKGYDQHNKDVAIIEKALGMTGVDKFKVLGQLVAQANDIPRMMLATFDVSPALLQGQILLAYNPRVWLRSVGMGIANFFDKGKGWQQFMDAHKETVRKIANYGPQLGSVESSVGVQESGLLTGRKFQGDGVLKRATRKFGENYDRTLTASRVLMAESLMRDTMSEKEKYDVMSFINEMTGTVSYARTNATETQRVWENALLFSPRYTRATLALLSDVARGGIKGKLARQALGKWAAAGLLLYLAICKALGQEPNLDPREGGKWLTFEVAGNNIGIGGAVYSTLRTGGKMAAEVLTGQPGEAVATLRKYLLSRGSPITSTMYKFLMREDYIGKPLDTLPELTRDWLKTNMVPTWLQATLEQGAIGDPNAQKGEGTVAMLTGLTGLRSYPVSAATARNAAREEYAQEWYGKKYDDLSAVEKARINSEAPGMAEKVQAAQQVGIEHRNPYSMFWDDVANVRQKYEDEIALLTSQLEHGQLSGNAYREAVQQRELLRAKVPEQLKQTAQYKGKVEDYTEEEPTTPVDRFINEYYDIPTKYTDPATGVGDAAKIVKARELLKQAYDTEVVDEAMAFINRNRSPEYVEAQKQWAEYQAIPQYLGMTRAQQDAANRASTTIRSWRRQNPYVSAAATKAAYARYDPEGYRLYVMSSKLANPARRRYFAAHPLLSKYYGDVEGEVLEANPYA